MTNRVLGVDQNLDLPDSVYAVLRARLAAEPYGAEWMDLTLPTGVTHSIIRPAQYRVTGNLQDRKFELRGILNIGSAGITTLATMPEISNENILGQQFNLYGNQKDNGSTVVIRVGRTTGLTLTSALPSGTSVSLDGIVAYV